MVTQAFPQFPGAITTPLNRQRFVARRRGPSRSDTVAHVIFGTMVGMMAGGCLAAAIGFGVSTTGTEPSVAVNSNVNSSNSTIASAVQSSKTPQVAENKNVIAQASSPSSPAISGSLARNVTASQVSKVDAQPTLLKASVQKAASISRDASLERVAYVSRPVSVVPAAIPANGVANENDIAVRASFVVEGDATVADYVASARTIETQDGRSFVLGATAANGTGLQWQDYLGNLHYRCDQQGNCTLFRDGVTVPNAKLTT